jgi:serpin B
MIILLPDRKDGISAVEAMLSGAWLAGWLAKLDAARSQEVKLWMPKFKLEQRHDLTDPLKGLGLRTALTNDADFSGMAANPRDVLKLGKIVQQTFVEVEEKGTEAAAATDAEAAAAGAFSAPPKPISFRADHPFLFLIRDQRTGLILFIGRFAGE